MTPALSRVDGPIPGVWSSEPIPIEPYNLAEYFELEKKYLFRRYGSCRRVEEIPKRGRLLSVNQLAHAMPPRSCCPQPRMAPIHAFTTYVRTA